MKTILISLLLGLFFTLKADPICILDKEKDALQCRIDMIMRAQNELLISTYIIRQDEMGLGLLQLMIEKAAQGVKIRLILDALGNDLPRSLIEYLSEKQIEVRLYNNARFLEFHSIIDRMHEKVLISDSKHVIVGGRNMSKDYFKVDSIGNFVDREIYTQSPKVANDLRQHFYTIWNHIKLTQKSNSRPLTETQRTYWATRLALAWQTLVAKTVISKISAIDWTERATDADIQATYDKFVRKRFGKYVPFDRKDRSCTRQLIALIDSAQHSIDIENPYFHPTFIWRRALINAIKRGVKVRLLTNSACTNDVLSMQSVYRLSRQKYMKMGIQIWEYEGHACYHTKSFIIDSALTVVGSYNIHIVSQKNNTEVSLWVKNEKIALETLKIMENSMKEAKFLVVTKANLSNWRIDSSVKCLKKEKKLLFYTHTIAHFLRLVM
ncbi:MAG: phosphatidylserine/phosphatidylglycerophosphate/cardiolipin synthase family protein [Saprospiraceae bacterium]|nr:phosphatidylserine/phosphatidylglycerophosphate/cardiolipin synthase family protein [Saprospiraceae bacterium]